MDSPSDAIISVKPKYANAIVSGNKTVELRRRIPPIEVGTRLWIYATRPVAAVVGFVTLDSIVSKTPAELWLDCGHKACVDRGTFDDYFEGAPVALGLYLSNPRNVRPFDIAELRRILNGFHPPQVMVRLSDEDATTLHNALGLWAPSYAN